MAQLNVATKAAPIFTAEGAPAARITPLQELIRLTMACLLWEDNFYSDGQTVGARLRELVHKVSLGEAASVAIEARENMKLRHVPLLIVREMARNPRKNSASVVRDNDRNDTGIISRTLARVIQRPDELTEFLAIYWADGKQPLSKQVKLGLAKAFQKFNEYSLAKYNRKKDIMLRDVLFLCHAKPADVPTDALCWDKTARAALAAQKEKGDFFAAEDLYRRHNGFSEGELLFGRLVYDQLATPDTWEVELSAGADKCVTFRRLMEENKLGDLAFLRNLRNMLEAGLTTAELAAYGDTRKWGRVLPFRFIAAARVVPQLEPHLERWMFKCLEGSAKLPGKTLLLVDVSGSMRNKLSGKSDLTRLDAAKALAMLMRELSDEFAVLAFDAKGRLVPPRRGFGLADAIGDAYGGTDLGAAVSWANAQQYDRLIVLTDEQSATRVPQPKVGSKAYMVNVACEKHGVGYGNWLHIDGFSEAIVDYIQKYEATAD